MQTRTLPGSSRSLGRLLRVPPPLCLCRDNLDIFWHFGVVGWSVRLDMPAASFAAPTDPFKYRRLRHAGVSGAKQSRLVTQKQKGSAYGNTHGSFQRDTLRPLVHCAHRQTLVGVLLCAQAGDGS
ncbi:hypothetical protein ABBQ38_001390 [Trebouxia sp. C0009 RCD-2024]